MSKIYLVIGGFIAVVILIIITAFFSERKGFADGQRDCAEARVVEVVKEVEVVKYVYKEKAKIWTRPSVVLAHSLERMRKFEI